MKATIVYIINVDWFFASHFVHLARRAMASGCQVVLAAKESDARDRIEKEGIKCLALPIKRTGVRPSGLAAAVRLVEQQIQGKPDVIVHGLGLFGILIGTLATRRITSPRCVYTITGRGYAAVSQELRMRLFRLMSRFFCRFAADGRQTRWIVENESDIAHSGLTRAFRQGRVSVARGAGVDLHVFSETAMPPVPPLRVAFVSRLIWSKGLDLAIAAVARARQLGANVELTIAGRLDEGNPKALTERDVALLADAPGVDYRGHVVDVSGLWREHHLAILLSRGGEGVPKSLIEAAACGRPVLTTNVPGCRELARTTGGWVVPVDDVEAAANALVEAASLGPALSAKGCSASAAVQSHYSEDAVWKLVSQAYLDTGSSPH